MTARADGAVIPIAGNVRHFYPEGLSLKFGWRRNTLIRPGEQRCSRSLRTLSVQSFSTAGARGGQKPEFEARTTAEPDLYAALNRVQP